jgi:hypothetical protein
LFFILFATAEKGRQLQMANDMASISRSQRNAPLCLRKTGGGLQKGLANLWKRKKIAKKAHATRGREIKWAMGAKKGIKIALCPRISGTDWKKVLANRWNRKKITKKAHAGRGLETLWEFPAKIETMVGKKHSPDH